ncbi:hypothetical protein Tco_0015931 [Tanacetum coccineum]
MMSKARAYDRHPAHKALYDGLSLSLSVDDDDMDLQLKNPPVQKNRLRDDQDQVPPIDADKESKKKKRKDTDAPSSKKTIDQPNSSKKEALDDEEPVVDEVVNTEEHPQDDVGPSQDRSKWFKQSPRPETLDPEWSKDPNADFIKHRLKKDQITKADLEGQVFKLLKGTCRSSNELEYHLEQRPPGRLTIPVEFFFNNDLEYLKNRNKERKYVASVTQTKAVRRVEDVQLGVESYQKKLNITKPQTTYEGISYKEPYTIFHKPRGVVYLNKSKQKRLMRADKLYTFSDGTLQMVRDNLHDINF